jgi:glycosyltransferase involved in cell wall biosynthesis
VTHTPRISVVTPSFQQAAFVEATLRSVVDQEYEGLEYVVIDGGSTDGSVEIIKRYEKHLAYWVSEPDNGHAHALNKGFARTSGDIMCWINSSDLHYPWTLQTVADVFASLPEVEWVMGMPSQFSTRGGPKSVGQSSMNVYDFLAGNYRWIQQESVFWRRSLWERAGGELNDRLVCAADFDLWLRFLRLAPLCHVGTLLAGFRVHDNRLGEVGNGLYERETTALHAEFVAAFGRRDLRRARLVRAVGAGRRKVVGQALHKVGVWPWYRHPDVRFDFNAERWSLRK